MRIAYARVSTTDQNLDLQIDALKKAGFDQLFSDHGASGASADRTGLNEALEALNNGDTLVVWRLDRLARSVYDLADLLRDFNQRSVAFESICEGLDTSHYFGECMYLIAGAFAHLERCILIERTKEGMAAAKARGAKFGRKPAITDVALSKAQTMVKNGLSVSDVANEIGVGRSTLYRYLQAS